MTEGRTTVTYQEAADLAKMSRDFQDANTVSSKWMRFRVQGGTSAEVDTGLDLPALGLVHDVFVHVVTAEASGSTKTLDVGLLSTESGGDADGFLDGVDVSAAGLVKGSFTYTDGTNQNYVSAHTRGVLLYNGVLGADVAGQAGTVNRTPHITGSVTAKSISFSRGSTLTELDAYVYIKYDEFIAP